MCGVICDNNVNSDCFFSIFLFFLFWDTTKENLQTFIIDFPAVLNFVCLNLWL